MKKAIAFLTLIIAMYSCQKDYEFKDEKEKTKTAKKDPDNQPTWITIPTTVLLYSSYQFNFSTWKYADLGGGSYSVQGPTYTVTGSGNGGTVTPSPVITSVSGNIVTFIVRIKETYFALIPAPAGGASDIVRTIIMTVKYNLTTRIYTVTYSDHSKW